MISNYFEGFQRIQKFERILMNFNGILQDTGFEIILKDFKLFLKDFKGFVRVSKDFNGFQRIPNDLT